MLLERAVLRRCLGGRVKNVIEHEKSHIARGDHYAKLVGYLLLSVYWFNPLSWIAYMMFCKDVERACDERVIAELDVENRKGYAEALLQCSTGRWGDGSLYLRCCFVWQQ